MKIGLCTFAVLHKKFPVMQAIKILSSSSKPVIAALFGTFGTSFGNLYEIMDTYPNLTVIMHMSNEVARRKGNMYRGELLRGYSVDKFNRALENKNKRVERAILRRVRRIKQKLDKKALPTHRLILSLGLEDQYSKRAVKRLIKLVRSEWPYEISRNPVDIRKTDMRFGRERIDLLELHSKAPVYRGEHIIWSNDGVDIDFGQQTLVEPNVKASEMSRIIGGRRGDKGIHCLWFGESQGLDRNSKYARRPRGRNPIISNEAVLIFKKFMKGEKL